MAGGFGTGRKRITQEQLDRLRRLYETHGTFAAVTAITGACRETLRRYKALGWKVQRDPRFRHPPTDLALMASKMNIKELRKHYGGVGQVLIYRWLEEKGIVRSYKSRRVYKRARVPSKSEIETALAQYGIEGAARHFGVHDTLLLRWRRQYNLPIARRRKRGANDNRGWVERYVAEHRRVA